VWANPSLDGFGACSFDNIWYAFMTLFEVASGDSWETVMYLMADIPAVAGEPPYRDDGPLSNCLWAFFCVGFVFIGQLFMMQLFVSVIVGCFGLTNGHGLMTSRQKIFNDMCKYFTQLSPELKPPVPLETWRSNCYHIFTDVRPLEVPQMRQCVEAGHIPNNRFVSDTLSVRRQMEVIKQSIAKQQDPAEITKMSKTQNYLQESLNLKMVDIKVFEAFSREALASQPLTSGCLYVCGSWFDAVLTTCIVTNIIFMCTVHYEQPESWSDFVFYQNLSFLVIFTFEMIIKLFGLGYVAYWRSPFDAFDGFTVLLGWVFVAVDLGAIAGIFRIGRVFRLVKRAPKLQVRDTVLYCHRPVDDLDAAAGCHCLAQPLRQAFTSCHCAAVSVCFIECCAAEPDVDACQDAAFDLECVYGADACVFHLLGDWSRAIWASSIREQPECGVQHGDMVICNAHAVEMFQGELARPHVRYNGNN
jgi:hypothetical protein